MKQIHLVIDTNEWIDHLVNIQSQYVHNKELIIIIPWRVLQELDKKCHDPELKWKAKDASRV